jgi:hypothetical protein
VSSIGSRLKVGVIPESRAAGCPGSPRRDVFREVAWTFDRLFNTENTENTEDAKLTKALRAGPDEVPDKPLRGFPG